MEEKYLQSELDKAIARNDTVATMFEKLYEDNASGKVSDEWFLQLSHKYEVERMELKAKIAETREKLKNLGAMEKNKELFVKAIRKINEKMQKEQAKNLLRKFGKRTDIVERQKNRVFITQGPYEHSIWYGCS